MTSVEQGAVLPLGHLDRFFVGGAWVTPSSDTTIDVIDPGSERLFFRVAEAQAADMSGAVAAARKAFDEGPWPQMTHAQRAEYLRALAAGLRKRSGDVAQIWPRQSGALHTFAQTAGPDAASMFEYYAGLADTFAFEEPATPT